MAAGVSEHARINLNGRGEESGGGKISNYRAIAEIRAERSERTTGYSAKLILDPGTRISLSNRLAGRERGSSSRICQYVCIIVRMQRVTLSRYIHTHDIVDRWLSATIAGREPEDRYKIDRADEGWWTRRTGLPCDKEC